MLAEEAVRFSRTLAEPDPDSLHLSRAEALQLVGRLRQQSGDPEAAIAALREAILLLNVPSVDLLTRIEVIRQLSQAYAASGGISDALAVLDSEDSLLRATALGSSVPPSESLAAMTAMVERGHLLRQVGRMPEAALVAYRVHVLRRWPEAEPELEASLASLLSRYAGSVAMRITADRGTEQTSEDPSSPLSELRPDPVESGLLAVDIYRRLTVGQTGDAYRYGLALALHRHMALTEYTGGLDLAHTTELAQNSVDLYERLVQRSSATLFTYELRVALSVLAAMLDNLGRDDDAQARARRDLLGG